MITAHSKRPVRRLLRPTTPTFVAVLLTLFVFGLAFSHKAEALEISHCDGTLIATVISENCYKTGFSGFGDINVDLPPDVLMVQGNFDSGSASPINLGTSTYTILWWSIYSIGGNDQVFGMQCNATETGGTNTIWPPTGAGSFDKSFSRVDVPLQAHCYGTTDIYDDSQSSAYLIYYVPYDTRDTLTPMNIDWTVPVFTASWFIMAFVMFSFIMIFKKK